MFVPSSWILQHLDSL
ncbi:hypothetical protein D0511_22055 [Pseudoalteromonas piscicida]|uniref:Uncharacterized protein n=1 Tax=Pseudoalteromonas piscicida TaxID=43662 RepID=A0AAD0W5R3_PSEO7|nr:hypothetical protein D0N37_24140 [Pseudoalteromonas piscicida]AXR04880.1 hypothetical protein D0511_22055 [Pseudoalteromonas piscicida]